MNITDLLSSTTEQNHNNMDNMDVSMNYDNSELLSSEFFDSVLCMENNLMDLMDDTGFLSNFEDEVNMSSDASHSDEVLSPESYYSESDKNSTYSTENTDDSTSVLNGIDGLDDTILLSICNPVTSSNDAKQMPVVATPVPVATAPPQKPTKILIQNPSNKKFIAKPILNATHLKKAPSKTKTQILKVHQVSNNGRQILLPLSVKSIKILNASTDVATLASTIKQRRIESVDSVLSDEDDTNFVSSTNNQYPALNLTNEEKRLLSKEGIQLPSHHPLTKNEERELKRIRRKIRNKISAQDSRKRKKEYVDGLEERVKRGSEENKNLLQRVKELQRENKTLIAHVNRLQALICKSTTSKATPSTCLMVVLLSALLVSIPNMRLFENKQMPVENEQVSIRRSLLSSPQTTEDDLNMEEFLVFKDEELGDLENKFAEDAVDIENSTDKEFAKMLDIGKKYENFVMENNSSDKSIFGKLFETMKNVLENKSEFLEKKPPDFGGSYNNKGFIEPDIDEYKAADDGPPLKRAKYVHDYPNIKSESVVSSTTIQISKDK
ncbi:cyclic AMP-responsive element-binding protein 3-like protein 1 [Sitophilus oryzae]|uniref:Cyclic AMP-responsive element-binding protein 3-like protein 1 n=1 Tax=Sitophilus oryzae TaxID=7048 RepID=A0A6J2XZ21_SITOR|nr:cyclic AMP-responsive element-binding protein 3-like protein 1 [Sitophilus oryzae]